jgi:hypothetical protein
MSQGNSLYNYLKQKCLFLFVFYKIREQEYRTGPVWVGWCQWMGWGEAVGKRCRKVNMVECWVHIHIAGKMRPIETVLGIRGGGDKWE